MNIKEWKATYRNQNEWKERTTLANTHKKL